MSTVSPTQVNTQTATLGATWAASTAAANDLRFNYSRTNASSYSYQDDFGGAVPLTSLPFPSPFTSQNGLLTLGIFSLQQGGIVAGFGGRNLQRQINIVDGLSVQKGAHSLRFGVDFRRLAPIFNPSLYSQTANFLDVPSSENGSLYFGLVGSNLRPTFLFRNLGLYAQDTWRVSPRLTLTYGLRWDVDFVPQSINGPRFNAVTGFNLNDLSRLALAPSGTAPYRTTYGNFAPRLGAAYEVIESQDSQTVLRGGVGVFYDLVSSEAGNQITTGAYPFGSQNFIPGSLFGGTGTFPFDPSLAAPLPITPPAASNSQTLFAFDPHIQLPYTIQWSGAIEQSLGGQQSITTSYVGSIGRRLIQTLNVLSPNPNLASAVLVTNAAASDYNALQIQFQRRLSHGLQTLASYTWSHSIDTASAGSFANASNLLAPGFSSNANRGSSDFDIRHAFSAGITYAIPFSRTNAFASAILRGWSLENVILARTAPPVDVSDATFSNLGTNLLNGALTDLRPDLVPGQPLYLYGSQCAAAFLVPVCPGGKGINPNAFTNPPSDPTTGLPLRQGDVPRNFLRGFGAVQWDFAVHRDFQIHDSLKLQFLAEMFNFLNHPNFGPPNSAFGSGGFGLSTQLLGQSLSGGNVGNGAFSPLYQIGGPRTIQLALKLFF